MRELITGNNQRLKLVHSILTGGAQMPCAQHAKLIRLVLEEIAPDCELCVLHAQMPATST